MPALGSTLHPLPAAEAEPTGAAVPGGKRVAVAAARSGLDGEQRSLIVGLCRQERRDGDGGR